jgi:hypothetical protein
MLYLIPRGILRAEVHRSGGPLHPLFRKFLILVAGLLLMHSLLLIINPEFAALRWPWELNPLDARIVAAWFIGWSVWAGTMAFARDWDEIRPAAAMFVLNGVALAVTFVVFGGALRDDTTTVRSYVGGVLAMTAAMAGFYFIQERGRPRGALTAEDAASSTTPAPA